jgi:cell division septum initiation protein DivIVA
VDDIDDPGGERDRFDRIGDNVAGILRTANRVADATRAKAQVEADGLLADARAEADEIVREAGAVRERAQQESDELVQLARQRTDRLLTALRAHEGEARTHVDAAVAQLQLMIRELELFEETGPDATIDLRDTEPAYSGDGGESGQAPDDQSAD